MRKNDLNRIHRVVRYKLPTQKQKLLGDRLHSKSKYDNVYTTEGLFRIWAGGIFGKKQ